MILTRSEEMLLLAVHKLQDEAYGVKIKELLKELVGKDHAFGALFVQLDRLSEKGLLTSSLSDPTPERGGRSKRIYKLTSRGKKALVETKKVQEALWENVNGLGIEKA